MVCSKMTSRRFIVATLLSVNLLSSLNTHAEASGSCRVQQGASSVGTPTFEGRPQTTYSCIANENCNYDVHILGNYEGNGHLGFRIHHTGNTTVNIRVSGQSSKPIVLVFVSYEPVNWILNIPSGVVIERVLLGSYNLSGSDVSGYTSQSVLNVERVPYSQLPYAYSSGGHTDEVLSYISGRFGPVASFSGSYRADSWTLNIQRNAVTPGCQGSTPSGTSSTQTTSVPPFTSQEPMTTENDLCSTGHGSRCIEWNNQSICTGDYYTGSSCVGGYCRCVDNPRRDYCTCLYKSGECHIEQGSSTSVGTPTFEGTSQTTYSCVANENCDNDVHIISNYEGNGHTGFRVHNTGNTRVNIQVSGRSSKPLILVFSSYEPVNWILNIPSGVVIDRILLGSYYLSRSNVSGYSPQSVSTVERVSSLPSGHGSDTGGGNTDQLLDYVTGRFGPVASFSGSYRADTWTLNIQRSLNTSGCQWNTSDATSSPQSTSVPPLTTQEPMTTENGVCDTGTRCIEWNNQYICSGDHRTGSSCVGGYCRCVDNPKRDYCTCLYISGECHIEQGSSTSVGTPTFEGTSQTTYSCVANESCQYDVHVISNYESNGRHGFGIQRTTGTTNVNLRVSGPNEGTKPLILVFVTYEPVTWILNIPSGVVIERILLGSYYLDDSSVTGYSSQSVLNVERHSYQTLPYGDGSDVGGGNTDQLLGYVVGRFGPIASFSGSYRADSWTLDIQRNLLQSDCQQTSDSVTEQVHITTSSIAATNPTPNSNSETSPYSTPAPDSSCSSGDRCIGSSGYCSGGYTFRPTCIDGHCRCSNVPNRDYCTCLSIIGSCHITKDNSTALGTPTFRGQSQSTYSCVANDNCRYNVHVIGNYESNGRHGFGIQRTTGRTNINLQVSGPNEGTKPLILVFVSYEPVTWSLSIPNGVVIERILLGSFYLDDSSVTGYSSQSVLNVERLPYQTLPYGTGSDVGGGRTDELLEYVIGRFGPVASFSGSYRADSWTLNIQQNLLQSDCQQTSDSVTEQMHITTSSIAATNPTPSSKSEISPSGTPAPDSSPRIGDIRLSGGRCSGNLQIYANAFPYGERWYQICGRNFGNDEAEVVCRQLGCSTNNAIRRQASFGFYAFVTYIRRGYDCTGSESSLSRCSRTSAQCILNSVDYGEANDHIAVRCQNPSPSVPPPIPSESISQVIGDIQLSNGCSGELQMYESLQSGEGWYSICESNFSEANSKVVCRNLGCSIDGATSMMRVSHSFLPSMRAHIYCYGYESSFSHCELTNMRECSSSQRRLSVHIECSNNTGDTLKQKTSMIVIFFIFTVILAMM